MTWFVSAPRLLALAALCAMLAAATVRAQEEDELADTRDEKPPLFQLAGKAPLPADPDAVADPRAPVPGEHPMMPALRWAYAEIDNLRAITDYSATIVKRERIDGDLVGPHYIYAKVRHEPYSVYLNFVSPAELKGQEALYIEGRNNGNLWAHGVGIKALVGTLSLPPTGRLAMQGNRYPITETGILNLAEKLIEVGEHDIQYGECEAQFFEGAKINGRVCTCMQFTHPVPRREFRFHLARIFVDDELKVPIRYEAYDWPREEGGSPVLTEEYTYLNLKLNNGFTDADFDTANPSYRFR
jgi:hypothetical protein